jgi:hypothetical protein
MSRKKIEPPADKEQQKLEQKVDAMMSVEAVSAPIPDKPEPKPEKPADILPKPSIQATAPQLPTQLLKTIGKSKTAKSTLKIVKTPSDDPPEPEPEPEELDLEPIETAPPEPDEPTVPDQPLPDNDPLEDTATDKAVDAIVAEEADMQLAVADAVDRQKNGAVQDRGPGLVYRFFASPWTWLFIIGIAAVTYAWYH